MTPFANWFISRADENLLHGQNSALPERGVAQNDTQAEITGLLDAILENLMTASVLCLRATMRTANEQSLQIQANSQRRTFMDEIAKAETRITDAVADALIPILSEQHLRRVIIEFSAMVKKLLPEFESQAVVIRAPSDLRTALEAALKQEAVDADIVNSDDSNISVRCDQVHLTAELSDWSMKLKEALAA
jgi:hypothetical protein